MTSQTEKLPRSVSAELDAMLGATIPVLDDGFIRVIDYMGNDSSIVQAARVSYGAGTKQVSEDRGLIRYLLRHRHSTPFEMCEIKLHVRVPMDCWRQWIRHRTASVNEYSTRYSVAIDAARRTADDEWRSQSEVNKQGSGNGIDPATGASLSTEEAELHERCQQVYRNRLEQGVAREQARKDLPLSTYTEAYWKIDLHNLLHFLALRMDQHAQYEIREYARLIGEKVVSRWVPYTWEAFLDYRFNSLYLSEIETRMLALVAGGQVTEAKQLAFEIGWLQQEQAGIRLSREAREFKAKLERLDLASPW
ncbi:MAG TPA: FAD-dependent thymidylate synthase [Desulfuromonadales bacterium]|nr:FAD-dependent thymidylate synthase [Desulfuromonadales bacterium]